MKTIYALCAGIIILAGVYIAGYVTACKITKPEIKIVEVEKPVFKYIQKIDKEDCSKLWDAYQSPIAISRNLDGRKYTITATDTYKQTTVVDMIEIGSTGNWKVYAGVGIAGIITGGYTIFKLK